MAQKDLLSRLADMGEDAIQKFAKAPGGTEALKALNSTRERLDEVQKKLRGLDALERRVADLEQQVKALAGKKPATAPRKPAARKPPRPTQGPHDKLPG
ncbi:MAG: hypothetical protein ACR2MU_06490 [Gaiellaceae bacterium]